MFWKSLNGTTRSRLAVALECKEALEMATRTGVVDDVVMSVCSSYWHVIL